MRRPGVVPVVAGVSSTVLALSGAAGARSGASYTVGPTQACLLSRPGAVAGLPPATPPALPVTFVYRDARTSGGQPPVALLYEWSRTKGGRAYKNVAVWFYKDAGSAKTSAKGLSWASLSGNVMIQSNYPMHRGDRWLSAVRNCLRPTTAASPRPAPGRSVPEAALSTLVGFWGGHTRGLQIESSGRGAEYADDGCCLRAYDLRLQIFAVSGTLTRATAWYHVISFRHRQYPGLRDRTVGEVGELVLTNGIVKNNLTNDFFCSNPAWLATGACGA